MRQCDKCGRKDEVEYKVCEYDFCYSCFKKSKPISESSEKKAIDEWMKEKSHVK